MEDHSTGGGRPRGCRWEGERQHPKRDSPGPETVRVEGQKVWAGCWGGDGAEMGQCLHSDPRNQEKQQVGKGRWQVKLQSMVLPKHSRPAVFVCVCVGGGPPAGKPPPAQFHPDAKGPVRNSLPGANQGQGAGGWRSYHCSCWSPRVYTGRAGLH